MASSGGISKALKGGLSRRTVLSGLGVGLGALAAPAIIPARAAGEAPELKTVTPGALTIAFNGDMPMSSLKDGQLVGADGEMVMAIAKQLGLRVAPALMDWAATIESVRSGRADLVLGNVGWSPARSQVMLLTDAIYYTGKFTLMRQDVKIGDRVSIDDMKGRSVGTVGGFTIVPELKKIPGTSEVKLYDTSDACVRDVIAGRLDFAFLDAPTVGYMIKQNPNWGLKLVPTQAFPGYKVLGQKQISILGMNAENSDLFDAVNAGVAWLWKTGLNGKYLKANAMESDDYLIPVPAENNPRIGVDRDEKGGLLGAWAHTPKDFSSAFAIAKN
jgi:polar amino acid transport system substrate-binding protein